MCPGRRRLWGTCCSRTCSCRSTHHRRWWCTTGPSRSRLRRLFEPQMVWVVARSGVVRQQLDSLKELVTPRAACAQQGCTSFCLLCIPATPQTIPTPCPLLTALDVAGLDGVGVDLLHALGVAGLADHVVGLDQVGELSLDGSGGDCWCGQEQQLGGFCGGDVLRCLRWGGSGVVIGC